MQAQIEMAKDMCSLKMLGVFLSLTFFSGAVTSNDSSQNVLRWRAAQWVDHQSGIGVTATSVLMSEFASRSGFALEVTHGNYFLRLVRDVKEGRGDVVMLPDILLDAWEEKGVNDSLGCNVIFLRTKIVAAGLKERFSGQGAFEHIDDLKVVARTFPNDVMQSILGERKYEFTSSTTESLVKALLAGRADLVVDVAFSLEEIQKKMGVEEKITSFLESPEHNLYLCFSHQFLARQENDFILKAQRTINSMAEDPEVKIKLQGLLGQTQVLHVGSRQPD